MDAEAGKSSAMAEATEDSDMVEDTLMADSSSEAERVASPAARSTTSHHTSFSRGSQGQIPMTPEAAPATLNEAPPTPPAVKVPRVGRVITPPMLAPTMNAHLQRHRPASAEIRAAIDGYDDDFKNDGDDVAIDDQGVVEDDDELVEVGPTAEQLIAQAKQEYQTLMEGNDVLQRKVRQVLDQRNKGRLAQSREVNRLDGAEARYRSTLRQWADLLEEKGRLESHYRMNMMEMQNLLDDKAKRVQAIAAAYKHFRMEVAKSAEHSKTGKPISAKLLSQLEGADAQAEEEVRKARLKNIEFSNKLKRLESQIADKEELAEGLHLIDFEQLKIENQSLNEKIEERNEELMKLRKKITSTVQVLTHMKEKLQFVEKANHKLSDELNLVETALASKREELQHVKTQRDKMRLATRKLKETSVYITSSMLLADMQVQKEERERCKDELGELKLMYSNAMQRIAANNAGLEQLREEMALANATGALGATTLTSATSLASNGISPSSRSSLGRLQAEKVAQAVHTTMDVVAPTS